MIQLVNLKQSPPSGSLSFEVNSVWAELVWFGFFIGWLLGLGFFSVDYLVWGFFLSGGLGVLVWAVFWHFCEGSLGFFLEQLWSVTLYFPP